MARIDGSTGAATPSGSGSSGTSTAAVNAAQADLTAAQQRVSTANDGVSTLESASESLESDVTGAQSRFDSAQDEVDGIQSQIDALGNPQADVDAANAAKTTAAEAIEQGEATITEQEGIIETAEADIEQADADIEQADEDIAKADDDIAKADDDIAQADQDIEGAQQDIDDAIADIDRAQGDIDAAQGDIEAAEGDVAAAQGRIEAANGKIATEQAAVNSARSELSSAEAALRAARAKNPPDQAAINAAQGRVNAARGRLNAAQGRLDAARSELATAQRAKADAERAKAAAERAKAAAEERKRAAEEAKGAAEEAKRAAEEAKSAAEEAKRAAEEAKAAAERAKTEAETKKTEAEAKITEAEAAITEAEAAITAAEADLEQAEADLAEAEEKLTELSELEGQLAEAQSALDSARGELDRLKGQRDEKRAQLEEARARVTEAEAEVRAAQSALEQARTASRNADEADDAGPQIAGDSNNDGILSAAERTALIESGDVDDLPQAERDRLLAQQAELERLEQEARDRYSDVEGTVTNSTDAAEQGQLNAELEEQATQEIIDERRRYYQENPYYVDASGDVFIASVDASGNLVLNRNTSTPPQGENPQLDTSHTATIETDRAREDVVVTRNVPRSPDEAQQTHTSTVRTDPAGEPVSSQLRLEQELEAEDGSVQRSLVEENYRPAEPGAEEPWIATDRVQEQSSTSADGEDVVSDRVTTTFAEDGITQARVLNEHDERHGQAESSRTVDTRYAEDGTTPTTQVVEESGRDAEGNPLLATRAETEYDDEGEPDTTFISRDGELPEGVTASEFVVWGEDSVVTDRLTGGPDADRADFEAFRADGTQLPAAEVPAEPQAQDFDDWLDGKSEDDLVAMYEEYGYAYAEQAAYNAYLEQFETETHAEWEAERDRIGARNEQNQFREVDPNQIIGSEDPVEWVRHGNNRFEGTQLDGNLVEPLETSTETPSAFDVPAQLQARASADAIDESRYATSPAAFAELDRAQATFEQQLAAAPNDAARERLMREYFAEQDYWIDRGTQPGDEPVLMASGWSNGAPSSEMFGSSRAADPHAIMARTGIEGQDDMGQPATIDVLQRMYVDGSQDDIVRTSYDGPAGAERTTVVGEHTNADDVVTERDSHASTMVSRTDQGLPPLAVTEISRERFDAETGDPFGEQYFAVAQSDPTMTSLEERRDYYGADGIIDDTRIENTTMSRNYDEELTGDFLDANEAVIAMAREDDFNPNDDGETVVTPPAGSYYSRSTTDVDYDAEGDAVFQRVDEESVTVADAGDENHNGVVVTETTSSREAGTRGGSTSIFGEDGETLVVPEQLETQLRTTEFDPDAGTAGGNRSLGHQFREITSVTMSSTRNPDGTVSNQTVSPVTTQTLREGHDDDWVFTERQLETRPTDDGSFEVVTDDEGNPNTVGDEIEHESLDGADHFEAFMEGWGGRIIGGLAIVAGIAGAVFTGGASLALTAVGVGLATTSFAYTALNYSQGEASGWDLALSGAGVVLAGLPAITGVKQLVGASRGARAFNVARAAGATDDVARGIADDVLRASTQQGRVATSTLRVGNTADNAMDANDAVDATRAALQGDFWGAGMMLFAIGGGAAAGRGRAAFNARRAPGAPDGGTPTPTPTPGTPGTAGTPAGAAGAPSAPDTSGAPDLGTPGAAPAGADPLRGGGPDTSAPASPATASGAPSVSTPDVAPVAGAQPLPGSNTGSSRPRAAAAPSSVPDSDVAGARGDGATADVAPAAGPITPVEVPGSRYERLMTEADGRPTDIAMNRTTELTPDQQDAVGRQTGLPHRSINPALREGATSGAVYGPDYDLSTHIANTDAAINGSTFAEAGTVYRGMRMDEASFQQLLETGTFTDAAYMSTSRDPRVALGFQPVLGDGRQVVMAIDVAPGQRGLDVDSISTERGELETLLPRNSQLEVVDVTIDEHGDAIVHARLVDPAPASPAAPVAALTDAGTGAARLPQGTPTPDAPASVESIFSGTDVGGGRVPVRGAEPGSVHYARDANGQISEYGVIGSDGVPDMIVRRTGSGDWEVITPSESNGRRYINPRQATGRPALPHEIPVATTAAGRAGLTVPPLANPTITAEQLGHVVRTHTAAGRAAAAEAGVTSSTYRSSRIGQEVNEHYFNPDGTPKSEFDASINEAELSALVDRAITEGTWVRQGDGSFLVSLGDVDGPPIGRTGGTNPTATGRVDVVIDADGNLVTAYPSSGRADGVDGATDAGTDAGTPSAAAPAAAGQTPGWGRNGDQRTRPAIEPPLPRDREIVGGMASPALAGNPAVAGIFNAPLGPRDGFAGVGRGIGPDGRVVVDVPSARRDTSIDNIIETNPDVVARLGGPDAVRANPQLLNGLTLSVRRSSGQVEAGWTVDGLGRSGGTLNMAQFQRTSMDLGEFIVRRSQLDPSFDVRAALRDAIVADPSILGNRPLRLRRSDTSINQGRTAHNIDDNWHVINQRTGPDGQPRFLVAKNYFVGTLPESMQLELRQAGYGPNDTVQLTRSDISVDQLLDYNRARLEGDHGQLPRLNVRYQRPDGAMIGVNRDLMDGPATARADQAVVHTQAALDYLYSRYGYVPTGGDITIVVDADGNFKNASMNSGYNVLSIGLHPGGGAAFDPSVIMHELGHKMVDDFTAGLYADNHPSGAIHEGFADVAAAGWTHDPIVGRVFDQSNPDSAIRDLRTGQSLLGTRQQWEAANQSIEGAGAHRGSGVVTGVASRLVPQRDAEGRLVNPRPGDMSWTEVGDLYNDALRSGALRQQMDFDSFNDALRIAAARRYGVESPQFARVIESLGQGGLAPQLRVGDGVSRITSRGTVEHGFQVLSLNADHTVTIGLPDGRFGTVPLAQVLNGGGRHVQVGDGGAVIDVQPRRSPATGGGHSHAHAVEPSDVDGDATLLDGSDDVVAPVGTTSATGRWRPTFQHGAGGVDPTPQRPTLLRRLANHLTITDSATAVSVTAVHTQQLLDRERRIREARLQAQLAELQHLQQFSERIPQG